MKLDLERHKAKMKLKEFRKLNLIIKDNGEIIYEGTTEELPDYLKEQEYSKISFEGTDVIVEL